jgi:hypothetical protein
MTPETPVSDHQAGAPAGQPATQDLNAARQRLQTDEPATLPLGTVEGILNAPSDLVEETIPVTQWGCSVKIRSLTAAQSAKVRGKSIDMSSGKPVMNWEALEKTQFLEGVVAPKFKPEEVNQLHHQSGPGFAFVIRELDRISGTDPKKVKDTLEAFQESE